MRSAITDMFGIDAPILAFSHCRDVVAAVSKAGGMGVLGAAAHSPEQLDIDLRWMVDELDGRPFGVDLIVPAEYKGSVDGGLTVDAIRQMIPPGHVDFVEELLRRYDVPALLDGEALETKATAGGTAIFSSTRADPQLDLALQYGAALVVNALGPPTALMIERTKDAGCRLGAMAGKASHAAGHVRAGVDVIIAQGSEAGGHTGEIGSMVLIPEIVDVAGDLPVLGAGGIGRGSQMAAAMALGAQGVWCGSIWLTTAEAETHEAIKEKLLAATSDDTIRSRSRTGKHARQLRSAWTDEWEDPANPAPLDMPLQPVLVSEALIRIERAAHQRDSGAYELATYYVGQIVGAMTASRPAAQVVYQLIDEFIDATTRLAHQLEA